MRIAEEVGERRVLVSAQSRCSTHARGVRVALGDSNGHCKCLAGVSSYNDLAGLADIPCVSSSSWWVAGETRNGGPA